MLFQQDNACPHDASKHALQGFSITFLAGIIVRPILIEHVWGMGYD